MTLRLRTANPGDAEKIASLHADSWRRHYRGAYADSYLDGDIVPDRLSVWASRLAAPLGGSATILAEDEHAAGLAGFAHAVFDVDARWGSLVDNLHVSFDRQRAGVGTALLARAAQDVAEQAKREPIYLWVLQQNTAAQDFYRAMGGACVEELPVLPPGGVPSRLNGRPRKLRFAWTDAAALVGATGR